MTKQEVLIVSAIGALWAVAILLAIAIAAVVLHQAIDRAHTKLAAHRTRRHDLNECRAINALGTTDHPQE